MSALDPTAQENLRNLIERIERLEEDKANVTADIKEVYEEAKSFGYDVKIVRKVVALRKLDRHTREEQEALLDLYLASVGG